MFRRIALAVVLLAGSAGTSLADDGARATADELVREGSELGRAGKLDAAIGKFKDAERAFSRAIHECNIGLAYARLKNWPRAHFFLVRCRERWSKEETRPIEAWVDKRIRAIVKELNAGDYAPVDLQVAPDEAVVTLSAFADDEPFRGSRIVWLPVGDHAATVTLDDHTPQTVPLAITSTNRLTKTITLEPKPKPEPEPEPEPEPQPQPQPEPQPQPQPQPQPPPPAESPSRTGAWITLGISGAVVLAGGVAHVIALDTRGEFSDLQDTLGPDHADTRAKRDDFHAQRNITYGLYAVGAIGAGVGLYLLLRGGDDREGPKVGAVTDGRGGFAWASWNF